MGTGNSQFTGTNAGRLTPGTQIVPQTQLVPSGQPPAVSSAGGAPANTARPMKAAQRVGPPATISGTRTSKTCNEQRCIRFI